MGTTIATNRLFRATFTLPDEMLAAMKNTPAIAEAAMRSAAEWWRDGILDLHFQRSAHSKYGYADRAVRYIKSRGKAGKPDLVKTGMMHQQLKNDATFKTFKGGVELRMHARALNLAPAMSQSSPDLYVKHSDRKKRGYPNMKREIRVVLPDEREQMAAIIVQKLKAVYEMDQHGNRLVERSAIPAAAPTQAQMLA